MQTGTTTLTTSDGPMAVYEVTPDGPARGAVLVIQEAFGVNDHIEDVARRFGQQGYRALAPHLFHRSGDPDLSYGNFEKVLPHMQALTAEGLEADLDACLAHLADHEVATGQVAVVGFCMGGTVAFYAGTRWALGASVTFYGGGVTEGRFGLPPLVELAARLRTPWLGLYGDEDQSIPVAQVEQLRTAVDAVPLATELVRYPHAGHGFHCDQRPDHYDAAAAADAWRRTLDWLERHLRR
jgi:carboxymethylenebutenolidase